MFHIYKINFYYGRAVHNGIGWNYKAFPNYAEIKQIVNVNFDQPAKTLLHCNCSTRNKDRFESALQCTLFDLKKKVLARI